MESRVILWRRLADSPVPMQFIAAGNDIRPSWPLAQLAALVPRGSFTTVPPPGGIAERLNGTPDMIRFSWPDAVVR